MSFSLEGRCTNHCKSRASCLFTFFTWEESLQVSWRHSCQFFATWCYIKFPKKVSGSYAKKWKLVAAPSGLSFALSFWLLIAAWSILNMCTLGWPYNVIIALGLTPFFLVCLLCTWPRAVYVAYDIVMRNRNSNGTLEHVMHDNILVVNRSPE